MYVSDSSSVFQTRTKRDGRMSGGRVYKFARDDRELRVIVPYEFSRFKNETKKSSHLYTTTNAARAFETRTDYCVRGWMVMYEKNTTAIARGRVQRRVRGLDGNDPVAVCCARRTRTACTTR